MSEYGVLFASLIDVTQHRAQLNRLVLQGVHKDFCILVKYCPQDHRQHYLSGDPLTMERFRSFGRDFSILVPMDPGPNPKARSVC